jgi:hypothetical protein
VGKFIAALQKGGESTMPQKSESEVIDETTSPGKEKAAAKQWNALLTTANLTMAFETKGLLGMIYKAMSNDWPAGLAYQVVVLFSRNSAQMTGYQEWNWRGPILGGPLDYVAVTFF